ncbi:unnamed protein product [Mesocestoides corti]|uniref:Tetraspanin n=1 Tax=Mesocestoides corti TaxID=53468 RepID=A0A158QTG2_MESCO|nr:unnamed protein product [Mesocestoides corti]
MALSCGGSCLKCLVFFFNAIVFLGGIVISAFGIYMLVQAKQSAGSVSVTLPAFITAFGLLIFLLGFLGCFGACYENRCMLKLFAVIVGVLLVAEIVCGIILLVYRHSFVDMVGKEMQNIIKSLSNSSNLEVEKTKEALDKLQSELKCCGGVNASDWTTVPASCCTNGRQKCTNPYPTGCAQAMYEYIKTYSLAFGLIILILCLIQVGAIICAVCLAKKINEYEKV